MEIDTLLAVKLKKYTLAERTFYGIHFGVDGRRWPYSGVDDLARCLPFKELN